MRIRTFVMFACLFLLVYCLYAGKGSVMGPLLGVAAVAGADRRKARMLELKGLIAERASQRKAIFDKCDSEGRLETESERDLCESLEAERRAFIKEHNHLESRVNEAGGGGAPVPDSGRGGTVPFEALPGQSLNTLGDRFVNSQEIKEWRGDGARTPNFPTPHVRIGSFFNKSRAIVTGGSSTSAGAFIQSDRRTEIEASWMRPLTVTDLITMSETTSDAVEYVRETFTNNAAPTPEATGVNDGTGGAPRSEIAFELVQENVKDITHYVVSTVNAMMDASQVKGEIDNALIQGVKEELEDQLLDGDGVGPNFLGILRRPNISLQAFDTDHIITARKAKTKVMVAGKTMPTAYLFNATIQETLDLAMNNQGSFYALGAPFGNVPATLWGIPRLTSLSTAVDTYGILADWRRAWLYDRQQSEIYAFNQHLDFAVRRLVAIMGVYRGAFAVKREPAFCRIAAAA